MKRIFIIDEHISSKQNGFGTYLRIFLAIFKETEHEITVISANDETKEMIFEEKAGYAVLRLPIFANGNFFGNGELIIPLLRRYISDDINNIFFVCHSPCSLLLKTLKETFPKSKRIFVIHDQGWTAPLMGDKKKLQRLLTTDYIPHSKEINYRGVKSYCREESKIYKYADMVVCLSESTLDILTHIYKVPESKVRMIPNGYMSHGENDCITEKSSLRNELGVSCKDTVYLFAGRIVPAKGILELLDAFEILYKKHSNVRLVIAGQVFNHDELTKHNKSSYSHILYTGLISKDELCKWYKIADAGVLPTYTEQCSYTALEMMAAHLPVITTDGNGIKDMFLSNESALVVPACQGTLAKDLAKAMERFLHLDNADKERLAQNAYRTLQTKYSMEKMAVNYQKLICELC